MINTFLIREACYALGMLEPISIEQDGVVWLGIDPDRVYPDMATILEKAKEIEEIKSLEKTQILERLGITEEEFNLLLGQ